MIRGGRHPVETSSGAARQCHEKSYSQRDQIECDQAFEEGPDAVSERDVLDPADKQGNRQDERDRRVEVRDQSIAAASSIIAIQAAPITPSLEYALFVLICLYYNEIAASRSVLRFANAVAKRICIPQRCRARRGQRAAPNILK